MLKELGHEKIIILEFITAAFKLTDSRVSPQGVIIANFERAGEVKTGLFAE